MGKPTLFLLEHSGLQETELVQLPFGKGGFLKTIQGSNKQAQAVGTLQVLSSTCLLSSGPRLDRRGLLLCSQKSSPAFPHTHALSAPLCLHESFLCCPRVPIREVL